MNNRKKITELTEIRWRTTHFFDEYGNRVRDREEYIARREVRSVKSGPRFGHFLADMIAFQIIVAVVGFTLQVIFKYTTINSFEGLFIALIINISGLVLYPMLYALSEYYLQRTPGKYLTQTLVIDEYGDKPDFKTALLRSIIRMVPFEPFSCTDNYSRGWHDKWSNTWVVPEEELQEIRRLQQEQAND